MSFIQKKLVIFPIIICAVIMLYACDGSDQGTSNGGTSSEVTSSGGVPDGGSSSGGSSSGGTSDEGSSTGVSGVPSTPAISSTTEHSLTVTWSAVTGATGYKIYMSSTSDGSYELENSSVTDTSYTDTSLNAGETYYYKISSYNAYGESALSTFIAGTTSSSGSDIPSNFTVWDGNSIMRIKLQWDAVAGAAGYTVYKSDTQDGTYTVFDSAITAETNTKTYIFAPGSTYYFKIRSNFSGYYGDFTESQKGTTISVTYEGVESEPNDATSTANMFVGNPTVITQTLSSSVDVDWYYLPILAGNRLEVYVEFGSFQTECSYGIKGPDGMTDIAVTQSLNSSTGLSMYMYTDILSAHGHYYINAAGGIGVINDSKIYIYYTTY